MNSALLTTGLDLLKQAVNAGGIILTVLGIVAIGTNLKEHNGPAITGGVFQFIGGIMIIAAAQLLVNVV